LKGNEAGKTPPSFHPTGEDEMPRQTWSRKRERQYEHVKESSKKRGASTKRAKEIAARTVNKERARSGEAKSSSRLSRTDLSSGRRGGQRFGIARAKGRTKEQLYTRPSG
jgi:hypothetical protein